MERRPVDCDAPYAFCEDCRRKHCTKDRIEKRPKKVEQIKPCPFCGMKPSIKENLMGVRKTYSITCKNEFCTMVVMTGEYYTRWEAIESWNGRLNDTR